MTIIALLAAAAVSGGIDGVPAGSESARDAAALKTQFSVSERDRPIVEDAIARWSRIERGRPMAWRVPVVFLTPSARCVRLHLLVPALGGSPVYCYRKDRDVLVEKDDEVD